MFYKVIKDNRVIDVLDRLLYLNYQEKHKRMQFCDLEKAQAILSSDGNHVWHEESLYNIPVDGYDTVRVEEIDEYEYERLKLLDGKSPEVIMDEFVLDFISGGTMLFIKSLKRLFSNSLINDDRVIALYKNGAITEKDKDYILS